MMGGAKMLRDEIAAFGVKIAEMDKLNGRLQEENAQLRKELMVANNRIDRRDRMIDSIKGVLAGRECV